MPGDASSIGKTFGTRARRVEDAALLTGRARFLDDISFPDMAIAAFVRSPHAHAAIRSIDASAARGLPGVQAVFTAADIRPHVTQERTPLGQSVRELTGIASRSLRSDITPFVLARDEVCYVGDPVAVVIADSRCIAEDAAALVDVDYDPLPAVADMRAAIAADAPRVHREVASNILAEFTISYGDCDPAFAKAAHTFSLSLDQHRGCAHPMEGRGVVARHDSVDERTTVWTSTQSPHEIRMALVQMLGVDDEALRIVTPDVGGGFGAKYLIYPEEVVVPLAARILGRPVKWVEDRRESFLTSIQERDQLWELEVALDADARIQAIRGTLMHDQGAYTPQGINVSYNSATALPGTYVVPSYAMKVLAVETNKVPTMPVRGAGYPQATFAIERLLDLAAGKLGLDRAEIRLRNLIPAEAMPYTTPMRTRAGTPVKYDSGDYPRCQRLALEAIDYAGFAARKAGAAREGRLVGLGIANGVKGTGRGPFETGLVRIGRSGRITVATGAAAMGQSTATMLAQIVADQFNVDPGDVQVIAGDTAHVPMGHGGFASRQAVNAGNSVHQAAVEVRTTVLNVAAELLNVGIDDLALDNGLVRVTGASNLSVSLGDIAREAVGLPGYSLPKAIEPGKPGLEHTVNFMPKGLAYANASHAVELEVDSETGAVRFVRYVVVSDCGNQINPMVVDGQILGGVVHGIGNALLEQMTFDAGAQPVSTNFAEYLLSSSMGLPRIELLSHVSPSPLNPLGVKGVGECGVIPATAAVIGAIEDALAPFGVRIVETPLSPSRILELIAAGPRRAN